MSQSKLKESKKFLKKIIIFFTILLLNSNVFAAPTDNDVVSIDLSADEDITDGITFNNDGTKMFFTGTDSDKVHEYHLSTPYDMTSGSMSDQGIEFSITEEATTQDIEFNLDGTKLFLIGHTKDTVYEYTLTTGFDLTTASASATASFSVASDLGVPTGMIFNNDGTYLYVIGGVGTEDKIFQYELSTGFDITTANSTAINEFSVTSEVPNSHGLTFSPDGKKVIVAYDDITDPGATKTDSVHEYTLSTPWNISTMSYAGSYATDDIQRAGDVDFNNTGSKMYVTDFNLDRVFEYDLTCGFSIVACIDPTKNKDKVALVEAQAEIAKNFILQTSSSVLNRIEWLRRHSKENKLTNQNIKFQFSNKMLSSLPKVIPVSSGQNVINEVLPDGFSYWSEGNISIGRVGDTSSSSTKVISTNGITFGVDKKTDENKFYGLAFRAAQDDVDVGTIGSSIDMDAYSLTLYGSASKDDTKFIDSLLGFSNLRTDIFNKNGLLNLRSKRDGKQIFSAIKFRSTFKKDQFNLTPIGKINLGYTQLDKYTETKSEGLALKYDKQKIQTRIASIGMMFDDTIRFKNSTIKPNGKLEYSRDFSPSSDAVLSYVSEPDKNYHLYVDTGAFHNLKTNIGFDLTTKNNLSITFNYERNQSKGSSHTDSLYFGGGYISNKETEYALALDGNKSLNANFDIKKNISGFETSFNLNYDPFSEITNQSASLKISNTF